LEGKRIEIIYTSDPYTELKPGDRGVVEFVDALGTVFVDWDNNAHLGLIPGEDKWKIID
jgi:hypothetical protein